MLLNTQVILISNVHTRSEMSGLMTKPTKWHVRPAKTQIGLGTHPAWSESSLSAWRKLGSLATHWVHSKDSDQTGQMPRLSLCWAHRSFCLFCHEAAQIVFFTRAKSSAESERVHWTWRWKFPRAQARLLRQRFWTEAETISKEESHEREKRYHKHSDTPKNRGSYMSALYYWIY